MNHYTRLSVTIPKNLVEIAKAHAVSDHRSMSGLFAKALSTYINQQKTGVSQCQ